MAENKIYDENNLFEGIEFGVSKGLFTVKEKKDVKKDVKKDTEKNVKKE